MEIKLHANATTTPRIRRYLQESTKSDRELSAELGISVTTVRRWRKREQVSDNLNTPKVIHKAMRQEQVVLINALRECLAAPLDDLLQLVNEGLGISVSRATLNRYLKPTVKDRKGVMIRGIQALKAGQRPTHLVLIHLPLSLHMDDGGEQHLLWAREPISGWCFARLYAGISPQLISHWAREVLAACPADIQSAETIGLDLSSAALGIALQNDSSPQRSVQVPVPLCEIIPRLNEEPVNQLLERICCGYNQSKAQKRLGDKTPQAFLDALRQND